jgi:hypothetical protein
LCDIADGGPGAVSPRRDWSEAEVLSEGFAANPTVLRDLQARCGYSNLEAAQACGVSLRTYRRWRSEGNPAPGAVRLLAVLAGYVPWDGWQGWEVHQGFLFPPGFSRGGILPGEFHALVFLRQLVTAYRQDSQRLRAQLSEAEARLLDAEARLLDAEALHAQPAPAPGPALRLVQAAG